MNIKGIEELESRFLCSVYSATAVSGLTGYANYVARGLNNVGQVVGEAKASSPSARAFVFKPGSISFVSGTGTGSSAEAINDGGTIVGKFTVAGSDHAFVLQSGSFKDLTNLHSHDAAHAGDYYGEASDVNAGNTAVLDFGHESEPTALKYHSGTFNFISGSTTGKINDLGTIAMNYFDPVSEEVKVTKGSHVYTIGAASSPGTFVTGINNQDQIVGYTAGARPFLYTPGGTARAFGSTGMVPMDINNQGIIVGHTHGDTDSTTDDRAFVYRAGHATDINTLVSLSSGAILTDAVGINDKGQIAVNGFVPAHGSTPMRLVSYLLSQNSATASISGTVYNDLNHNGHRNTGEPGLSSWQVYVDSNHNGVWDIGEQIAITDSSGAYHLKDLSAGTYRIYEVRKTGWTRSQPAGAWPSGFYDVTLSTGASAVSKDFGDWM